MQGASEPEMRAAVDRIDEALDRKQLALMMESMKQTNFLPEAHTKLSCPALFIKLPLTVPGADEALDVYRLFAPRAVSDEVFEFPLHMHEEEGGHEVASKVIPFIKRVIAEGPSADDF
jgi:hypothetical protein